MDDDALRTLLTERATILTKQNLARFEELTGQPAAFHARALLLAAIDRLWMKHLEDMDDIRESVGLNSYAQRKPIVEYRLLGGQAFDEMIETLKKDAARFVMCARPRLEEKAGRPSQRPTPVPKSDGGTRRVTNKVGPNDKCPCGSGKKYKYCCGVR